MQEKKVRVNEFQRGRRQGVAPALRFSRDVIGLLPGVRQVMGTGQGGVNG